MPTRYLTLGRVPELRLEPQGPDVENPAPELEVFLRIDELWELSELLQEFRFAAESGHSTLPVWRKFTKKLKKCIIHERDRVWFAKNALTR